MANIEFEIESYMQCTEGNHNKDYLIVKEKGSIPPKFFGSWGKIGRPTLGAIPIQGKDVAQIIAERKNNKGYKFANISKVDFRRRTVKILERYYIEKPDETPTPDMHKVSSETERALKNLKEYVTIAEEDRTMYNLAVEIGQTKNAKKLLTYKFKRILINDAFMRKAIFVQFSIKNNKNKISDFLKGLNPGKLDKAKISEEERKFMRGIYKNKSYSLPQLFWLYSIADRIDVVERTNDSPFI